MTLKIISTITCLFIATTIFAQNSITITGKWKGEEKKELFIEIYKANDGFFYGKNEQGKLMLQRLQFDAKANAYKGKMVPPDKNISFDITLFPETATKIKLVGKKFFITKTFYLIKIK